MIQIAEYLTTKVSKSIIKATNWTLKDIVKEEMDKYGHDCDLNYVDVSQITSMNSTFCCSAFGFGMTYCDLNPDISEWNVSHVKNMKYMFYECKNFNCDISKWDVSNVENMQFMFAYCTNFNKDISLWNVRKVEINGDMFKRCQIEEKHKPHFSI